MIMVQMVARLMPAKERRMLGEYLVSFRPIFSSQLLLEVLMNLEKETQSVWLHRCNGLY